MEDTNVADAWKDTNPHARFMRKLLRQRADVLLNSHEWLQSLRHNWEELKSVEKRFNMVFQERGIDFMEHVIRNTSSKKTTKAGRSPEPGSTNKIVKKFIFFSDEMPISTDRSWRIWYPIQKVLSKYELFMPQDVFQLLCKFVPHVEEPELELEYDAEKEDPFLLPCVKII
jgi:hypothetical protein